MGATQSSDQGRGVFRFPYGSYRRGQRRVVEEAARVVEEEGIYVLQAPTGFGKTAAVLEAVARALGDEKVVYVVRTRNEIAPVARELSRGGARYTILFNAKLMCPLARDLAIDQEDFWLNCSILRSRGLCPYFEDLAKVSSSDILKLVLRAGERYEEVPKLIAEELGACPFFALASLVREVPFVVATYPYFFREEVYGSVMGDVERGSVVLIVDEAHTLANPTSVISEKLSASQIRASIDELRRYLPSAATLIEFLERVVKTIEGFAKDRSVRHVSKGFVVQEPSMVDALVDAVNDIKLSMVLEGDVEEAMSRRLKLSRVARVLKLAMEKGFETFVQKSGREVYLHILPVSLDPVKKPLEEVRAAILMSGTMPPPEFFEHVLRLSKRVFYRNIEDVEGPVFPRENSYTVVLLEPSSSYRLRSDRMYRVYARYIDAVFRHLSRGVLLVVYPSYEFMSSVRRFVETAPSYFEDEHTTLEEVAEAARGSGRVAIHAVAGGKVAEGIELLDDEGRSLIKVVFLAGLPYPQPDDYTKLVEERLSEQVGARWAREFVFDMTASIRARQALGRALRSSADRALYILGDKRFLRPRVVRYMRVRIDRGIASLKELAQLLKVLRRRGFLS